MTDLLNNPANLTDEELQDALDNCGVRMMMAQTMEQRMALFSESRRLMAEQEKRGLR